MKKKLYSRPVCVMLSEAMYQRIFEITEKEEISVSEYVRRAVEDVLTNIKETTELIQKGDKQ